MQYQEFIRQNTSSILPRATRAINMTAAAAAHPIVRLVKIQLSLSGQNPEVWNTGKLSEIAMDREGMILLI